MNERILTREQVTQYLLNSPVQYVDMGANGTTQVYGHEVAAYVSKLESRMLILACAIADKIEVGK